MHPKSVNIVKNCTIGSSRVKSFKSNQEKCYPLVNMGHINKCNLLIQHCLLLKDPSYFAKFNYSNGRLQCLLIILNILNNYL